MLVLTRRLGEHIVIDDLIRVTIVAVDNGRVKLGITAPDQVTVHREDVHRRLQDFRGCKGHSEPTANAVESG